MITVPSSTQQARQLSPNNRNPVYHMIPMWKLLFMYSQYSQATLFKNSTIMLLATTNHATFAAEPSA